MHGLGKPLLAPTMTAGSAQGKVTFGGVTITAMLSTATTTPAPTVAMPTLIKTMVLAPVMMMYVTSCALEFDKGG